VAFVQGAHGGDQRDLAFKRAAVGPRRFDAGEYERRGFTLGWGGGNSGVIGGHEQNLSA
jgi:hypothetical protein